MSLKPVAFLSRSNLGLILAVLSSLAFGPAALGQSEKLDSLATPGVAAKLKCLRSIPLPGLREAVLAADGRLMVTSQWADKETAVKVWDTKNWTLKRKWKVEAGTVALSARGTTLAFSVSLPYDAASDSIPCELQVWDVASGRLLRRLSQGDNPANKAIYFSPDDRLLGSDIGVWNASTWKRLWRLKPDYVWPAFEFSPDGRILATAQDADYAGADGHVRLWNARTGKPVGVLQGSGGADGPIAFSLDGKQMATSGKPPGWVEPQGNFGDSGYPIAYAVKLWDVRTGKFLRIIRGQLGYSPPVPLGFLPGNKRLLVQHDSKLSLWDLKQIRRLALWESPSDDLLLTLSSSPRWGHRILAITDNSVDVYRLPILALQR